MARRQEFYKGRRKRRNYAIIPSIIIVGLVTLIVVLFYGMQKYAVITKEGVSIELPILNEGKTTIDAQGNEVKVFDPVDAEVIYDTPDYLRPGREYQPGEAAGVCEPPLSGQRPCAGDEAQKRHIDVG